MTELPDAHREALLSSIAALNPDAILYEPRELFDRAIVGLICDPADRWEGARVDSPGTWVVVYSFHRAVSVLVAEGEGDFETASEWVSYNSMGGWYGPETPTWIDELPGGSQLFGLFPLPDRSEPYEMT